MKPLSTTSPEHQVIEFPPLNETQRILKQALMRLGQNGEGFDPDGWPVPRHGRVCAVQAVREITRLESGDLDFARWNPAAGALDKAAQRLYGKYTSIEAVAYMGWPQTKEMYELAIHLSAST